MKPSILALLAAAALAAACCAPTPASASPDSVHVALTPAYQAVVPGANFEIDLTSTRAGAPFNAFDAVVGWDSTALRLVSNQQGSYMTGACGNTFNSVGTVQHADSFVVTESLLCNGISLTGPGQLYRLFFQAKSIQQTTFVRLLRPGLKFYNAGIQVLPVDSMDAEVIINANPAAVGSSDPLSPLRVSAAPSLFAHATTLRVTAPVAGYQSLVVYDLQGRAVRHLWSGESPAGERRLGWNGRDDAGRRLPSGRYVAAWEIAGRAGRVALTLLR